MANRGLLALRSLLGSVSNKRKKEEQFKQWLIDKTGALPASASVLKGQAIDPTNPRDQEDIQRTKNLFGRIRTTTGRAQPVTNYQGQDFYTPGRDPSKVLSDRVNEIKIEDYLSEDSRTARKQRATLERTKTAREIDSLESKDKRMEKFDGVDPADAVDYYIKRADDIFESTIRAAKGSFTTMDDAQIAAFMQQAQESAARKAQLETVQKFHPRTKGNMNKSEWANALMEFLGGLPSGQATPGSDVSTGDLTGTGTPDKSAFEKAGEFVKSPIEGLNLEGTGALIRNLPGGIKESSNEFSDIIVKSLDNFIKGLTGQESDYVGDLAGFMQEYRRAKQKKLPGLFRKKTNNIQNLPERRENQDMIVELIRKILGNQKEPEPTNILELMNVNPGGGGNI